MPVAGGGDDDLAAGHARAHAAAASRGAGRGRSIGRGAGGGTHRRRSRRCRRCSCVRGAASCVGVIIVTTAGNQRAAECNRANRERHHAQHVRRVRIVSSRKAGIGAPHHAVSVSCAAPRVWWSLRRPDGDVPCAGERWIDDIAWTSAALVQGVLSVEIGACAVFPGQFECRSASRALGAS